MIDLLLEALRSILQNSPTTVVLMLVIWYLYRELKEVRSKLLELYSMRIEDMKELSTVQKHLNDNLEDLTDSINEDAEE
jgi:hypothetical protein